MAARSIAVPILVAVSLAGLAPAADDPVPAGDAKPLFDGKTLAGWRTVGEGKFDVEDGAIRGTSERKSFLVTEKTYGDFVLDLETLVEAGGNSGVQFRSHVSDKGVVFGYQAEIDTSARAWSGGLYDEGRRAWINPLAGKPALQAAFKNGEWNRYRVAAEGDRLRIWVNGILTTDERDPLDLDGLIGLQHHGEKGKVYRWRNIAIRDLGRSSWAPLFDGKSLEGWASNGAGEWTVEDGALVGRMKGEARHGLLFSRERFGDFTVRFKFKSVRGNSGFYFRVEETADPAGCAGFQAEIDPANDVGGLYETGGRGWVVQPRAEDVKKWFRPGEWNDMAVSAHGGWIVVHVNGQKSAELRDDPGRREGHLAFQLHGGQEMLVCVKGVEVLRGPAAGGPAPAAARPPVGRDFTAVDPAAAAADPDFAVQGEYEGTAGAEGQKAGLQVVALGGGEFDVVSYIGGLPGDGWKKGMERHTAHGKLAGGVLAAVDEKGNKGTMRFGDGELSLQEPGGKVLATLKKVHRASPTLDAEPPAGAVVLFDGMDADKWEGGKRAYEAVGFEKIRHESQGAGLPHKHIGTGLLNQHAGKSKATFKSCTVHVEFRTPYMPGKRDQDRGNSGVYLEGRYEVQVLDSFGVEPRDNQCGGIYSVAAPEINMSFPPLAWQTYDIDFAAPEFDAAGKKVKNARLTVRHNGVLVHENREADHTTTAAPFGTESAAGGPLYLQDHGCPVRYRNVWVLEKK